MESNWRMNVARMGLVGSQTRLCARFVHPTILNFYLGTTEDYMTAEVLSWPDPDQLPIPWGALPTFGKNFPYGYEVESDRG